MSLTTGSRLGPYEVLGPIGSGGMGEVYRARDTRLDRTVAIKVLSAALAADPQFRERFEREARSLSAIAHPHICTLYDVGREDDIEFLVMEYLEGETLADRLRRGPLPISEALRVATQIADALHRAHSAGIVHRDLKPGNIVLGKSGAKLLDFGLARQGTAAVSGASGVAIADVTRAAPLTTEGTILGTFQYMAPEQVEGREADARSDIWAFGCVLQEMLTGQRPFEGGTPASLIAAILERPPAPMAMADTALAPALQRLVSACLEKNPDDRFQSLRDVRRELEWIARPVAVSGGTPERGRFRGRWVPALLAVALVAATALVTWMLVPEATAPAPAIFDVTLPARDGTFTGASGMTVRTLARPAVSPDGRRIAFVASRGGSQVIFVRTLDSKEARPLRDTAGTRTLFWSPDGATIGFFAAGQLKTVGVDTGELRVLCDAPAGFGGTWSADGTILFSPDEHSPIFRVSAAGGTPQPVTTLDASRKDLAHRWPHWLPDGRHFVFMPWSDGPTVRDIQLASVDGGPTRTLFSAQSAAIVGGNHFFYVTDIPSRLVAQAYDPSSLQLTGQPFAIVPDDNVDFDWVTGFPSASASQDTLVYTTGKFRTSQLTWMDRSGRVVSTVGDPGVHFDPRLSPDDRLVAIERNDPTVGSGDLWTLDIARGAFSRLTSDRGFETMPVWSPDRTRIAYSSDQGKAPAIYVRNASGSGDQELLVLPDARSFSTDWSADGRYILLMMHAGPAKLDLWAYDLQRKAGMPIIATPFNEGWGTFSPDGRWIAYVSDEDQERQVYVRPFPESGDRVQISTAGGSSPQWRRDGKELFYVAPDNALMAVSVTRDGQALVASPPQRLFTAPVDQNKGIRNQYAATSDGQRFLVLAALDLEASPLVAVLNWPSLVKR